MLSYTPPLRDMEFVLRELLQFDQIMAELPPHCDVNWSASSHILAEAARFSREVLFPLNAVGDQQGCTFDAGEVRTPAGFKDAYQQYCAAGWQAIVADPDYGGQGLPYAIGRAVEEMLNSANQAWAMYSSLTHGAYSAIHALGTPDQKQTYLPKLTSGEWTGTMCMTEPQCGTDLSLVRTRAEPDGTGTYRVSGTKIFISAGEHDLSENIVHLVLARLPDAPPGTKGLSLFIVPKWLPHATSGLGERNAVHCGGIERKMGIHGNSTCTLHFESAQAWLLGEPHRGLPAMFVMMNGARLTVGMQSLGLTETAYQSSREYAKNRLQSRSLSGVKSPELPADPILVHPDVRRMLLTQKAYVEAGRALAYWIASLTDQSKHHPEPAQRSECEDLIALFTPVAKAFFTDNGFACANLALQVFGGHGYIRENGVEQLVRDARINMVYEGTNAVQAMDLLGRKVLLDQGAKLRRLTDQIRRFVEQLAGTPELQEFTQPLAALTADVERVTQELGMKAFINHDEVGAAAVDYLNLIGQLLYGYLWARMARVALAAPVQDVFYQSKVHTARFYFQRILPETSTLLTRLRVGVQGLVDIPSAGF